jgi:hypothetical protein
MLRAAEPHSIVILLAVAVLLISGCGYRSAISSGHQSSGANGISGDATQTKTVRLAILGLRNDSPEPWLDRIVGNALRRKMSQRRRFDVVVDPAEADVVLRGRIRPLLVRSNTFSSFVAALEYEVTLALDLEVVRGSGDIVRLNPRGLSEKELYLASPDIEVTRTNRLEALRHLSDILASRIADSLEMMEYPISAEPDTQDGQEETRG